MGIEKGLKIKTQRNYLMIVKIRYVEMDAIIIGEKISIYANIKMS